MTALKLATISAVTALLLAGCNKTTDNTANYKSTINAWYAAHPACLWPSSQTFPTQVGSSDETQNAPFAALVDQGLLVRTTSEKKILIVSRQETNYDLSSKGRSAWTPDPSQPGAGNFCYGNRSVAAIDGATPTSAQLGSNTTVTYHYGFSNAPDWAKAQETQNAFPAVQSDLAGAGTATATLVDTANGWQMQTPPPAAPHGAPLTPADGKIVQ